VDSSRYLGNVIYGAVKAAADKLTADMAHELRPHGIAAIALYPGLVRTEAVLVAAKAGAFDLSNSESPQFIGRVVAALDNDPNLMALSGRALVAAAVARDRGVLDIDGKSPEPMR
jgi:NAD(P)-dependent dehydrogenase (short-subunit alcohol dehydrogenase family)